ncbi:MAG: patatin-like phospholipase family protein [Chloroflexi bacterium]|nr:patatin-like phospholipase family protein [Chloroflexota bacterium]
MSVQSANGQSNGANGASAPVRALVLSGGGVLGALQAGILRALFRTPYQPDLIVGTSVGALNGAFVSFRPDADGADELVNIWGSLRDKSLFMFNPLRIAYQMFTQKLCLFNSDLLKELVEQYAPADDFGATKIPLYITTTNLSKGHKQVFHEGPISRAILASTALPGFFCPVEIDGDQYVDGGVLANLDLETALDLGATEILAIDLSRCIDGQRPDTMVSLWMQTLDVIQRERVESEMARLAPKAHITLIQPGIETSQSLSSFSKVEQLMDEGQTFGEKLIDAYREPDGRLQAGLIHKPLHIHK